MHYLTTPIKPGPLTRESAEALTEALRDLYGLLGGFNAAPPLTLRQDAGGVSIGVDPTALADLVGVTARKNSAGSTYGPRPRLNFIEGAGVTLTVADDPTDNEVDVTIAASGGGGTPTFSGCRVHLGSNQSIATGTQTPLAFAAEDFDAGGYHDNVTNNTHFTVPTTGYYLIGGEAEFTGVNALGCFNIQLLIRKNSGGDIVLSNKQVTPATKPIEDGNWLNVSSLYFLTSGDYVELLAGAYTTGAGGNFTVLNGVTHFWISLLGT